MKSKRSLEHRGDSLKAPASSDPATAEGTRKLELDTGEKKNNERERNGQRADGDKRGKVAERRTDDNVVAVVNISLGNGDIGGNQFALHVDSAANVTLVSSALAKRCM